MHARRDSGFSLIELVVTLAILALLASMAVPFAQLVQQRHKETELREALRQIRTAIDQYKQVATVDNGPIPRTEGASGYPPNLDALWRGVADQTKPDASKLYFLRRLPRSHASPPDAPAPGRDVFDVYSLSSKTGLNGVPYREW